MYENNNEIIEIPIHAMKALIRTRLDTLLKEIRNHLQNHPEEEKFDKLLNLSETTSRSFLVSCVTENELDTCVKELFDMSLDEWIKHYL